MCCNAKSRYVVAHVPPVGHKAYKLTQLSLFFFFFFYDLFWCKKY